MAVAFVAHAEVSSPASAVTVGLPITPTGSNRCLYVTVCEYGDPADPISVTFNGAAFTKLQSQTFYDANGRTTLWRLVNPAAVTANIVVTFASGANGEHTVVASAYTGVDQNAPEVQAYLGDATVADSDKTLNVMCDVGDLCFATAGFNASYTLSDFNTQRSEAHSVGASGAVQSTLPGTGAPVAMRYALDGSSGANNDLSMMAFGIRAAVPVPGLTVPSTFVGGSAAVHHIPITANSGHLLVLAVSVGAIITGTSPGWNQAHTSVSDYTTAAFFWRVSNGTETVFDITCQVAGPCSAVLCDLTGYSVPPIDASGELATPGAVTVTPVATDAPTTDANDMLIFLWSSLNQTGLAANPIPGAFVIATIGTAIGQARLVAAIQGQTTPGAVSQTCTWASAVAHTTAQAIAIKAGTTVFAQSTSLTGIAPTSQVGVLVLPQRRNLAGIGSTAHVGTLTTGNVTHSAQPKKLAENLSVMLAEDNSWQLLNTLPGIGIKLAENGSHMLAENGSLQLLDAAVGTPIAGIGPHSAVGTITPQPGVTTRALTGIAPVSGVGPLRIRSTVNLAGIASTALMGATPVPVGQGTIRTLTGIGSTALSGALTPHVGAVSRSLSGIAPGGGVGTVTPFPAQASASLTGIASTAAVGTLTTSVGATSVNVVSIDSTAVVGTLAATQASGDQSRNLVGIAPTSAVGGLTMVRGAVSVALTGIAPTSDTGLIGFTIRVVGIAPTSGVGTLTPNPTAVSVALDGIAPTSDIGVVNAVSETLIQPLPGIGSTTGLGSLTAVGGPTTFALVGIDSSAAVGTITPLVAQTVTFSPGIASTSRVGTLIGLVAQTLALAGIASTSAVGGPPVPVAQLLTVTLPGIASTAAVSTPSTLLVWRQDTVAPRAPIGVTRL